MPRDSAVIQTLQNASEGLQFLSETDAPFTAFFWLDSSDEILGTERLKQLAKEPDDVPIETEKVAYFFRNSVKVFEGEYSDYTVAKAEKFKRLVRTIEATLKDAQVFRVGEISIDVYIIGRVEGGYAGLKTLVVET